MLILLAVFLLFCPCLWGTTIRGRQWPEIALPADTFYVHHAVSAEGDLALYAADSAGRVALFIRDAIGWTKVIGSEDLAGQVLVERVAGNLHLRWAGGKLYFTSYLTDRGFNTSTTLYRLENGRVAKIAESRAAVGASGFPGLRGLFPNPAASREFAVGAEGIYELGSGRLQLLISESGMLPRLAEQNFGVTASGVLVYPKLVNRRQTLVRADPLGLQRLPLVSENESFLDERVENCCVSTLAEAGLLVGYTVLGNSPRLAFFPQTVDWPRLVFNARNRVEGVIVGRLWRPAFLGSLAIIPLAAVLGANQPTALVAWDANSNRTELVAAAGDVTDGNTVTAFGPAVTVDAEQNVCVAAGLANPAGGIVIRLIKASPSLPASLPPRARVARSSVPITSLSAVAWQ